MMKLLLSGAYVLLGFVQLFAIADYFGGGFFSLMWAFFLTYIPLVGSVFGVLGAHQEWGWELWQALMLFFWYIPVMGVVFLIGLFEEDR